MAAPSHPWETCGGPWLDGTALQQYHSGALAAAPTRSGDLSMSQISRSPVRRDREQPTSDTPRPTGDVSTGAGGGRGQWGYAVIRAPAVPTRRPQHPKPTRLTATGRQSGRRTGPCPDPVAGGSVPPRSPAGGSVHSHPPPLTCAPRPSHRPVPDPQPRLRLHLPPPRPARLLPASAAAAAAAAGAPGSARLRPLIGQRAGGHESDW